MRLLDFLKGEFSRHVAENGARWTPISPGEPWRNSSWWQGSQTAAGIAVNNDTALNSATAFACTRAIAETLASLPAVVFENLDMEQRQKARGNSMWSLLHDQPNPQMDSMTWYELNAKRVVNRGNALCLKEFNGRGLVTALWPVHNSRWEARRSESVMTANGRWKPGDVFYRIWPDDTNRWFDVGPEEVLNVVGFDSENGIVARGVVGRARQEVALDIAEQEYAGSMFKNGALPLGLIRHPWLDDEEQRTNLRADINSMHSGRENWNRVGFLWDKDAAWMPLNFNPKDVQAIESRVFTAKTLCRYYGVPPAIVQIFDDYKFASVEAMLKQFVMLTIRPYAVRFERAIKSQLLSDIIDEDLFLEFALEGLLRGDPKAQAETNAILRQWGVLNADEWRQRDMNLNPVPGGSGQTYLAPLNYAPLDMVASGETIRREPASRNAQEVNGQPKWDKSYAAALMAVGSKRDRLSMEVREHAWRVIDRQYVRMLAKEVNGIRRLIAKGPSGFIDRMDEFYAKFEPTLADALSVGAIDGDMTAESRAACDASRQMLLAACECEEKDFEASIESCLASWAGRQIHSDSRPENSDEPIAA